MQITKQFRAEICHRLMEHPGQCKNLHGHSYLFEVTIEGGVWGKTGMVLDFKDLKQIIGNTLERWDHKTILHKEDPLLPVLEGMGIDCIPFCNHPTAENMAQQLAIIAQSRLGQFSKVVSIKVWETTTSYAEWRGTC